MTLNRKAIVLGACAALVASFILPWTVATFSGNQSMISGMQKLFAEQHKTPGGNLFSLGVIGYMIIVISTIIAAVNIWNALKNMTRIKSIIALVITAWAGGTVGLFASGLLESQTKSLGGGVTLTLSAGFGLWLYAGALITMVITSLTAIIRPGFASITTQTTPA